MTGLTWLLPVLLCGGGMLLCMLLMNRTMGGHGKNEAADSTDEVAQLREEVARLRAEQEEQRARRDG